MAELNPRGPKKSRRHALMVALAMGVVSAVEAGLRFDSERTGEAVIALLRGL